MSPLLRAPDKTPRDIEAFLEETHPGADARTRLHTLICCLYHAPLFEGRGSRQAVAGRAAARGVTSAKLRQIVAGDLSGIKWPALEAVLAACGAFQAHIEVAQDLFNQVQAVDPHTVPPAKAASWIDPLDDWAPVRLSGQASSSRTDTSRAEPVGPPPWTRPDEAPRPDTPDAPETPDNPGEETASGPAPAKTPADPETPVRCGADVPGCIVAAGVATAGGADAESRDAGGDAASAAPVTQAPVPSGDDEDDHTDVSVDPWTAGDPGAFVALMQKFRVLKGERPYREMEKACARHPSVRRPYAYASFCTIAKSGKLPRRDLVCAYIAGAGGSDAEIDQWLKAHARLAIRSAGAPSANER